MCGSFAEVRVARQRQVMSLSYMGRSSTVNSQVSGPESSKWVAMCPDKIVTNSSGKDTTRSEPYFGSRAT